MQDQQAFEKLKNFFETHPASLEASKQLKNGTEVGVVLNENIDCAFVKDPSGITSFQMRKAVKPDFIFYFSPEALENLVSGNYKTMADVAIQITKNYLAGTVRFKFVGSPLHLLTKGYLKIVKAAGFEYTKFLSSHGFKYFN